MGTSQSNYTSPQPGLLDTPISNLQSNSKGRVSQMLSPVVVLGQTTGQPTSGNPVLKAFGLTSNLTSNPNQIVNLTQDPNQNITIVLGDGSTIAITFNYYANQQGWFYNLNYNNGQFVANGRRVVASPNMLSAFQNIIPFGLAVTTTDGYEPIFIDDFATGRASLFVLEADDVAITEAAINDN